jgi:hypothetical protein
MTRCTSLGSFRDPPLPGRGPQPPRRPVLASAVVTAVVNYLKRNQWGVCRMPSPLSDLQQLRTVLGQLDAERPAMSGTAIDCMPYVEREDDFQQRLELELTSRRGKARLLVTGQIGVGKSSEVRRYIHQHSKANSFQVFCDLEKEMQPEHCGAAAVLLAIFRDCWSAASHFGGDSPPDRHLIRNATIEKLVDWLKGEYKDNRQSVVFRFHGMEYPVSLRAPEKDTGLLLILGKAALHQAVSSSTERFGLIPDALLNQLNRLLDWIRAVSSRHPVIFVDHVDKIRDPTAAKEVLIDALPQWQRLSASLVMTAPFEYTLGELRHSVESRWNPPLLVYPLNIPNRDDGPIPQVYWKMALAGGLRGLIQDSSLRLLAHYSGGIPRYFVQFLRNACLEAHLASHERIEPADCMVVVNNAFRNYQDYSARQLELLDEIDQYGSGLGEAAELLRSPISLLVQRPSTDEQQIAVHPLAQPALERFRLKHGDKKVTHGER